MKKIGKDVKVGDVVESVFKGVASVVESAVSPVPVLSPLMQAVADIKGNVLRRRYETWQNEVNNRLSQLEDNARQNLGDNDSFATTLIKATELAAQTNTIKTQYLANGVKYAAENQIDEDSLILLLNDIAKYTTSHFKVLVYMQSPAKYKNGQMYMTGSIMTYFEGSYPDFDRKREELILNDLYRDGLIDTNSNGMVSSSGMEAKRTTDLGDLFISFFNVKKEDYE